MASDVKWIKITTDVFDDEKIILIESLPDAYAIITVWFKLLCLAGKQNNSGVFLMGQMPYTDKMLATIFRMKESTVALALQTFQGFGMVEIIDGVITIPNWNKHQSLDAYEKKKERDRLYQAERRASQRLLAQQSSDKSSDVAVSEEDEEREKEKELKKNRKKKSAPLFDTLIEQYSFSNLLTDKLRDWIAYKTERNEGYKEQGLKALLTRIASKASEFGDKALCDAIDESMANGWKGIIFDRLKKTENGSFDTDDFFQAAVARTYGGQKGANSPRSALERQVIGRTEQSAKNPPKTVADDDALRYRAEALRERLG